MTPRERYDRRSYLAHWTAIEGKSGLRRLNGPISAMAMLELKSLQLDLEYKIRELEEWSRTAKTANTSTETETATHGSDFAASTPTSQRDSGTSATPSGTRPNRSSGAET